MDRKIHIDGVRNGRDLGGLPAAGGRIRENRLLRAACLSGVPQEDVEALKRCHRLSMVIDLRTDDEIAQKPETLPEGVSYRRMPIFDAAKIGITHEKGEKWNPERPSSVKPDMAMLYRMMVEREDCQKAFSAVLAAIMTHDFDAGSVLWHCSEGKDRCGLVAALLLGALGAPREVILEDYLLTNEVNEARAQKVYGDLLASGHSEEEAAMIRELFLAKEEYLNASLSYIDGRFGGIPNYLREALRLPEDLLAAFRAAMVV